ncbi:MAG: phosphotransferase family protein [Nanoarchaeota archaeon]|nr:phosphotransferase family protein [Nanoarchaeota archaeon]
MIDPVSFVKEHVPGFEEKTFKKPIYLELGLTNNCYLLEVEGETPEKYVLRVCNPNKNRILQIDRDLEKVVNDTIVAIGISPKVVFMDPETGSLLTEYIEGTTHEAEILRNKKNLDLVIDGMKKLHSVKIDKEHKSTYDVIEEYNRKYKTYEPDKMSSIVPDSIDKYVQKALEIKNKYAGHDSDQVLCHLDLTWQNLIFASNQCYFIDWEYAKMADPMLDIAGFAIHNWLTPNDEKYLLKTYFDEEIDDSQTLKYKEMKFVWALKEGFWAAIQSGIQNKEKCDFYRDWGKQCFDHVETIYEMIK